MAAGIIKMIILSDLSIIKQETSLIVIRGREGGGIDASHIVPRKQCARDNFLLRLSIRDMQPQSFQYAIGVACICVYSTDLHRYMYTETLLNVDVISIHYESTNLWEIVASTPPAHFHSN